VLSSTTSSARASTVAGTSLANASRGYGNVEKHLRCGQGTLLVSVGCSHLTRRLSGPALECMRECAHLVKAEEPGNFGYMQLAVIEVTHCQIMPQLLKYFSEV
jgi:hypothetical protein